MWSVPRRSSESWTAPVMLAGLSPGLSRLRPILVAMTVLSRAPRLRSQEPMNTSLRPAE
jgi:hypothetical protein